MDVATYRALVAGASVDPSLASSVVPKMPRRGEPEYDEQVRFFALVACLAELHPSSAEELEDVWSTSSGGRRDRATAGKLKAAGQKRGVPDIEALIPIAGQHGLVIELKPIDSGRASKEQSARLARLRRRGYRAELCHGWVAAGHVLCDYLRLPWPPDAVARVEAYLALQHLQRRLRRRAARRESPCQAPISLRTASP